MKSKYGQITGSIFVKNREFFLDNVIRISPNERHYRLSAISKNSQLPSKFITGRGECWHWVYTFIYTDTNELFGFEFDYNDKLVRKLNHNETLNLFKI